ncbi:hypothetical protein SCUCBS95973_009254 [Sporothrix curviconia]|uniref:Peptidase A1 domain-containing protein n=1 Tax=Sporothrix curviconia TaxID=1260050 RepID=A0ABP0CTC3_9PEZI
MSCAPYPAAVRLGNVTLSNNMTARGMNMSIGSPPQALAFMPLMPLNNSIIYGTDGYCLTGSPGDGPWTDTGCTTFRAGAYDSLASSSKAAANADAYPYDGAGDPIIGFSKYPQFQYMSDALHLNDNVTISGFPLGVALNDWGEQGYFPTMGIGLGTNSTILNLLVSTGQIASRSWSFFWGRTTVPDGASSSTAQQLDGSVVFGGYDRAKVTGTKYTQPMTATEPECASQLVVNIADIVLNFANGSDVSIFPASSSAAMAACISPALPTLMWMPLDPYFTNMMTMTDNDIYDMGRSVGIYYWNMRYETSSQFEPYGGDLTIKLQSGLSVRISNDQLVRPHTSIDQTTGAIVVNSTAPDLLINSLQSTEATRLAQIGWQFFSAAYLLVNQDANEFTLWEANPTTAEDLVAVDTTGAEVTQFCAASSGNTTTGGGGDNTNSNNNNNTTTHKSVSAGVIAGSVVGAVAAICIAAGLLVWWLRRRRLQPNPHAAGAPGVAAMGNPGGGMNYSAELDALNGHSRHASPQVLGSEAKYYSFQETAPPVFEVHHELQA